MTTVGAPEQRRVRATTERRRKDRYNSNRKLARAIQGSVASDAEREILDIRADESSVEWLRRTTLLADLRGSFDEIQKAYLHAREQWAKRLPTGERREREFHRELFKGCLQELLSLRIPYGEAELIAADAVASD